MSFILASLIVVLSCQSILGGVVYNPESVCSCRGSDNVMYQCLCPQPMEQDQNLFPQAYTSPNYQNGFGQFVGHNVNNQPRSNYDSHSQYLQQGGNNNYYQRYGY